MELEYPPLAPEKYNRTTVFVSGSEGTDVLVRTGGIESSSFIHACLCGTSREYLAMTDDERTTYLKRFRSVIFSPYSEEQWRDSVPESTRLDELSSASYTLFEEFSQFVNGDLDPDDFQTPETRELARTLLMNQDHEGDLERYQVVMEVLGGDCAEIFRDARKDSAFCDDYEYLVLKGLMAILDRHPDVNELDQDQYGKLARILECIVTEIHYNAQIVATRMHNELMSDDADQDPSCALDATRRLRRQVYILDYASRLPVEKIEPVTSKKQRALIMIRFNGPIPRYEPVGRLLPHNKIQREFDLDEFSIQRLDAFLLDPEAAKATYGNEREEITANDTTEEPRTSHRKLPEGSPVRKAREM